MPLDTFAVPKQLRVSTLSWGAFPWSLALAIAPFAAWAALRGVHDVERSLRDGGVPALVTVALGFSMSLAASSAAAMGAARAGVIALAAAPWLVGSLASLIGFRRVVDLVGGIALDDRPFALAAGVAEASVCRMYGSMLGAGALLGAALALGIRVRIDGNRAFAGAFVAFGAFCLAAGASFEAALVEKALYAAAVADNADARATVLTAAAGAVLYGRWLPIAFAVVAVACGVVASLVAWRRDPQGLAGLAVAAVLVPVVPLVDAYALRHAAGHELLLAGDDPAAPAAAPSQPAWLTSLNGRHDSGDAVALLRLFTVDAYDHETPDLLVDARGIVLVRRAPDDVNVTRIVNRDDLAHVLALWRDLDRKDGDDELDVAIARHPDPGSLAPLVDAAQGAGYRSLGIVGGSALDAADAQALGWRAAPLLGALLTPPATAVMRFMLECDPNEHAYPPCVHTAASSTERLVLELQGGGPALRRPRGIATRSSSSSPSPSPSPSGAGMAHLRVDPRVHRSHLWAQTPDPTAAAGVRVAGLGLRTDEVAQVVQAHADEVRECFEGALELGQWELAADGKLTVPLRFVVDRHGAVSSVDARPRASDSRAVQDLKACVGAVVGRLSFPRSDDTDVQVTYPFVFRFPG